MAETMRDFLAIDELKAPRGHKRLPKLT